MIYSSHRSSGGVSEEKIKKGLIQVGLFHTLTYTLRLCHFSHCELYIHSHSNCIWSMYLSVDPTFVRACGSYYYFLDRGLLLTRKLPNQGFLAVKLKSSLRKFYAHHHYLVNRYGVSVSQITTDLFRLS